MLIPTVVESTSKGERAYDLYSRMMKDRIIFMNTQVEENMSGIICASLLFLENENPEAPIYLYINSPGGVVTAGLAIYDTMQFIKCPVYTVVMGQACSMGSFLAMAGEPGHRYVLSTSTTMIHQPSGGSQGQVTDMEIRYKEISRLKTLLTQKYVDHNSKGKTYAELESAMERDNFMSAETAVEWGLADHVLTTRADLEKLIASQSKR